MASNIERFKEDFERLIAQGRLLEISILKEVWDETKFKKLIIKLDITTQLPDFKSEYEAWYSEASAVLRQLLPHRVNDFVSLYEKPKGRKSIDHNSYVIQDFIQGLCVMRGIDVVVDMKSAIPKYRQQFSILKAAKARFESSLFEIRQLVQADLFDSEIDAAHELLKSKFCRAAGAVAGVILEKHLRQLCEDHNIKIIKKHPGISDLNDQLKENSVVDVPQWRFISMLGDIRNLCDHSKATEPTIDQVKDLIDGAAKCLKTLA